MTDSLQWTWNDGWILMSVFLTHGKKGAQLHDIIAAADATNHAIPTAKELSVALTKFIQCELVEAKDQYVISAELLLEVRKASKTRGGLFKYPEKGLKWLKRSGLTTKNNQQIELTEKEVESSYQKYIKLIQKR